jgi:tryptophan-rich hypothetical protein
MAMTNKTTNKVTNKTKNKMMNHINPKALINSKWTKVVVDNKEKHFIITVVKFNEQQKVVKCVIEAVMTKNEYTIDWRELKHSVTWLMGWQ